MWPPPPLRSVPCTSSEAADHPLLLGPSAQWAIKHYCSQQALVISNNETALKLPLGNPKPGPDLCAGPGAWERLAKVCKPGFLSLGFRAEAVSVDAGLGGM